MSTTEKRFSKEKWLEAANAQMEQGFITQQDVDNALETWVNDFDGKTKAEIGVDLVMPLNEDWFV